MERRRETGLACESESPDSVPIVSLWSPAASRYCTDTVSVAEGSPTFWATTLI